MTSPRGVGWAFVMGVLVVACSSSGTTDAARQSGSASARNEPRGEPMPHEACVTSGDIVTASNENGQQYIRTLMEGGRPRCRETDANFDGRVDIYRWFDPSTGNVTRVEDDYDFDGRIDVVATFENNVVVRDILDTNFDGRTDTWREYRNGRVAELRRDGDGDGRVDTWERFDDNGRLVYEAVDANRDGEPDAAPQSGYGDQPRTTTTTAPATTPAAPAAPAAPATTTPSATPAAPAPTAGATP